MEHEITEAATDILAVFCSPGTHLQAYTPDLETGRDTSRLVEYDELLEAIEGRLRCLVGPQAPTPPPGEAVE